MRNFPNSFPRGNTSDVSPKADANDTDIFDVVTKVDNQDVDELSDDLADLRRVSEAYCVHASTTAVVNSDYVHIFDR